VASVVTLNQEVLADEPPGVSDEYNNGVGLNISSGDATNGFVGQQGQYEVNSQSEDNTGTTVNDKNGKSDDTGDSAVIISELTKYFTGVVPSVIQEIQSFVNSYGESGMKNTTDNKGIHISEPNGLEILHVISSKVRYLLQQENIFQESVGSIIQAMAIIELQLINATNNDEFCELVGNMTYGLQVAYNVLESKLKGFDLARNIDLTSLIFPLQAVISLGLQIIKSNNKDNILELARDVVDFISSEIEDYVQAGLRDLNKVIKYMQDADITGSKLWLIISENNRYFSELISAILHIIQYIYNAYINTLYNIKNPEKTGNIEETKDMSTLEAASSAGSKINSAINDNIREIISCVTHVIGHVYGAALYKTSLRIL
jgi:hypothetical protein